MLDYFDMESTLSEEERMLVDSARSFIDGEVEDIGQHWIDGTFPMDLIPKMGEMGFYAPNLEGYGLGVSETAYGPADARTGGVRDSGLRSMASVQGAGDVPHPRVRQRRAEGGVVTEARHRRGRRLLRTHRAGARLEPLAMETRAPRPTATTTC